MSWRDTFDGMKRGLAEYGLAAGVVGLAAVVCLVLRPHLMTIDVAMLFLLAVVVVAARSRQGPALLATALSIALFDFLFVPPYYTFNVHDSAYYLTFGVMLVVAVVMGRLTTRIREQAEEAAARERRTAALYALNRALAVDGGARAEAGEARAGILAIASRHIGQAGSGHAAILLAEPARPGVPAPSPVWPTDGAFESVAVRVAATWAFEHGEAAGWSTPRCAEAEALLVPLVTSAGISGLAVIRPQRPDHLLSESEVGTVVALADQAAAALDRATLAERTDRARAEVEAERLRTALLSSLSHDLRTPLGTIQGAASTLLEDAASLPAEVRRELLEGILEESGRMTRLVTNLLDMVRVETGTLAVKKAWQPLEEALGVALLRSEERLRAHPVKSRLPSDLPLVPLDELLIEQVFINLLENAAKYTAPGTPILISAWPEDHAVLVEVADRGPGVPSGEEEAVFGRFYRSGGTESAGAGAGSGLGLTICRGIIAAHGGRIWIERHPEGGAAVRFTLPLDGPPVDALPAEPLEG